MQKRKKVILIGAGSRGKGYTNIMKDSFDTDFEVVAVEGPFVVFFDEGLLRFKKRHFELL